MVRRVDRNGEALVWCCRKCLGNARQRTGPKLMNRCKPKKMDTKECGQMLKRRGSWTKHAEGWKIEGPKKKGHEEGVQNAPGRV